MYVYISIYIDQSIDQSINTYRINPRQREWAPEGGDGYKLDIPNI